MVPRISDAEWRIMKLLWDKSPRTSNEIIEILDAAEGVDWNPKTIKTLLNRLVNKGALVYEKSGRSYLYLPKVGEKECKRLERQSFLDRVYSGSLKPMLAAFLEDENMTQSDIDELKKILDQKSDRKKS
ncbi:BlaI/MecI/CopY family transcriptional regulator [candidate division KSB1 bacterium]|nr:BlaI/MecI/CopY family transcriptional regulator [candidate division KSB1 bacterium]